MYRASKFKKSLILLNSLNAQQSVLRRQVSNLREKARIEKNRANAIFRVLSTQNSTDRETWCLPRGSVFWESDVPQMNNDDFKKNFRVSRDTFGFLLDKLKNHLKREDTVFRKAIPVDKRLGIALYSLASSAETRTIANLFGVGRSTANEIFLDFCEGIILHFEDDFLNAYPPSPEKVAELVSGFERKWGFPQTYGAVDGCHIEATVPDEVKSDYYNYKGWYSTVLLACVDYRYRFTYVNIGSPGRNNDSYIFERSTLKDWHQNDQIFYENSKNFGDQSIPILLLGDSAFRLAPFLMKPYPEGNLTPRQRNFNYYLSRSRRVVENAFGQLKNRFRRIGKGVDNCIENVPSIVRAACILHNILNERNDVFNEDILPAEESGTREQPTFTTTVGDNNISAGRMRDALADYLFRFAENSNGENQV